MKSNGTCDLRDDPERRADPEHDQEQPLRVAIARRR
jgi:hypothetical protein